jgi:hypothetical protein
MFQAAVGSGIIRVNEIGSDRGVVGDGNDLQCVRSRKRIRNTLVVIGIGNDDTGVIPGISDTV